LKHYHTRRQKKETERTHVMEPGAAPSDAPAWLVRWSHTLIKDKEKEGKLDPEGLLAAADAEPAGDNEVQLLGDSNKDSGTSTLTNRESQAYSQLLHLIDGAELHHRYAQPVRELALSLKEGAAKRSKSKSIVTVLVEVLTEIRKEQANQKSAHSEDLNSWYEQIHRLVQMLLEEDADQDGYRSTMENRRLVILEKIETNEDSRLNLNKHQSAKISIEDRCSMANEEYGVREGIRKEDLENLAKLKSLLRGLFEKKMPKACPKHNRNICTSQLNGWCVYIQEKAADGDDQRCSCNNGFYGDACQFRMCPGFGKDLYAANARGVCSNRGTCDQTRGLCTCDSAFYHGPKNACDYKHAPASMNGKVDDQCSDGKGMLDKVRGTCTCSINSNGAGCEEKRCPNSNGVLYPATSSNACNGHGACNTQTGKCTCRAPYKHGDTNSCEEETCPQGCRGRGDCDVMSGKCSCNINKKEAKGFHGPACEFKFCPTLIDKECSGGGHCNRNDGKCICNEGYSGPVCAKTSRCTATNLQNSKMNWWTVWDQPGWIVCPKGQLLYKLDRSRCGTLAIGDEASSTGGALSCVESGGCAAPCEASGHVFQIRHCYHDLRWYNSFDEAGKSTCLDDYFVAGLFRSCDSLYCLNMAKCCSFVDARWIKCGKTDWGNGFNGKSDGQLSGTVPENSFIVGFARGEGNALANIKSASHCEIVRWY